MSEIVQLYKEEQKITKVYPKTVATEVYVDSETTVSDVLDGVMVFSVDNTSNVEIPQTDEKLEMVGKKYDEVKAELSSVNSSLEQIITKLGFLDKLKLKFVYSAKSLGGNVDDDIAIYNYISNENIIYIPKTNYTIENAISLESVEDKFIFVEKGTHFITMLNDEKLKEKFNIFNFKNSKNITFCGGKAINKSNETISRILFYGGLIRLDNVDGFKIYDTETENMNYGAIVINGCKNGVIFDNKYINKSIVSQSFQSGIIVYGGGQNIEIYNNEIIGQSYDGSLSIFGANTKNVRVHDNTLLGYYDKATFNYMPQGITIDQGPTSTHVYNNYLEGFWYGIDVKAETHETKVYNNTIYNCKVGISDRQGEATLVSQSYDNEIYNNKIILSDSTLIKDSYIFQPSGALVIGIHSADRYGSNIHDNTIVYKNSTQVPYCGIYLLGKTFSSAQYDNMYDINNNKIILEYAFASNIYVPTDGSMGVYINGANAKIKNNTFVIGGKTRQLNSIAYKNSSGTQILSNNFKHLGTGSLIISCRDDINSGTSKYDATTNVILAFNTNFSLDSATKPQLYNGLQDVSSWKIVNNIPWNV